MNTHTSFQIWAKAPSKLLCSCIVVLLVVLAYTPAASAQTCTPAPVNLVSWWAADDNALDSRSRHNGTLQNGATFAAGNAGQGFSFDGGGGFVAFPTANFQSIRTMEFWLKTTISNQSIIDGGPSFQTWRIEIEPNGKILYRHARNGGAGGYASLTGMTTVTDGQFYHIVTQSDSLAKTLKIFVNGALDAPYTETDPGFTSWAGAAIGEIKLGKSDTQGLPGPLFFNGIVDEFGSYDRILTTSEILAVFNAGTAGKCKPTATVAPSGLVGWWAGDGNPNDISGNNNNGTLENGAGFAISKVGQGFNFDGGDDFVRVGNPTALNFGTGDFSVQAWVKTSFLGPSAADYIISKSDTGNDAQFILFYNASGNGFPSFLMSDGTNISSASGTANLADGTFHHLAGVREGMTLRLYVDGVQVGTATSPTVVDATSANNVVIGGRDNPTSDPYFNGIIDEVQFFNRALTQDEITSIFNAGLAGKLKTTTTLAGSPVSTNVGSDATITFPNVSTGGTTQQIPLDTTLFALPAGFTHTGLAYDIATAASVSGNIHVSFHLPSVTTQSQFGFLKVLHQEGGVFVDRTVAQDFATRTLTAQVSSLSPFVIANGTTPTSTDGTIGGRILAANGNPVEGIAVRMSGTQNRLTVTDARGRYRFDNVETNGFYTVTPSRANFTFSPSQRSFSQLGHHTEALFTGQYDGQTANPLDRTEYFVRQQYVDFLDREPDEGGFNYWVNHIEGCGADPVCLNHRRIDVSNAFYYELEFQQTGSYAYRLYRAAYGNNQPFPNPDPDPAHPGEEKKVPLYLPFMNDRARVRGGPQLAELQLALASEFVQRPEFTNKYPVDLDGPGFVDALLGTINHDLGANLTSQRQALIDLFNAGGRGRVMYRIADDNVSTNPINNRALIDAEYNRAFVFTQYAGYLRRNADMAGFLFWLGQVNSAPLRDVLRQHAMVCSFITSAEYQQRFSSLVTHSNAQCQPQE